MKFNGDAMPDDLLGDVPWAELIPGVRAAVAAHRYRHTIQRWTKHALMFTGLGRPGVVVLGRSGVGKTMLSAMWKGSAGSVDFERPKVSKSVEPAVLPIGKWSEIVHVVPGQTSKERDVALRKQFGVRSRIEGAIYVVDWGFTSTRDRDIKQSLLDEKLNTMAKYRERQLEIELEDFAQVCVRLRESIHAGKTPKWLVIAVNKIDLYFAELEKVEQYYHPRFKTAFGTILRRELLDEVGAGNLKVAVLPISVWDGTFEWNGEQVASMPGDSDLTNGLFRHFLSTISDLSGLE